MTRTEFDAACATLEIEFPISATSGRRTEYRNGLVGGHPNSYHLSGRARDYAWDLSDRQDYIDRFRARTHSLGLRLVEERDHDHLQPLS